jgi:hypothetical protein
VGGNRNNPKWLLRFERFMASMAGIKPQQGVAVTTPINSCTSEKTFLVGLDLAA